MRGSVSKTRKYRADLNERILNSGFQEFNKFFAMDARAYVKGRLDAKTKEMLGLVASMVLRCNDCIFYHLDRCVTEGCSREELYEAMHIALIVGGSIVIPHLRYGFQMLDELMSEDTRGSSPAPRHSHASSVRKR
ncbi:MAG: carboxymuconolactone decarboxylase family protein [Acidobacteriia bacterium]|nr:carboxymuconolactone decarboxylase family protein [Terriglobia bacterium]